MNRIKQNIVIEEENSDDTGSKSGERQEIGLKYIIENKPKPSIVRDFLKTNALTIKSKEREMFENAE